MRKGLSKIDFRKFYNKLASILAKSTGLSITEIEKRLTCSRQGESDFRFLTDNVTVDIHETVALIKGWFSILNVSQSCIEFQINFKKQLINSIIESLDSDPVEFIMMYGRSKPNKSKRMYLIIKNMPLSPALVHYSFMLSQLYQRLSGPITKFLVFSDINDYININLRNDQILADLPISTITDQKSRAMRRDSFLQNWNELIDDSKISGGLYHYKVLFDTDLYTYNNLLRNAYSLVQKTRGSIVNETPSIRRSSGELIPLLTYNSKIFELGNNISWLNNSMDDNSDSIVITTVDHSWESINEVSDYKTLEIVFVSENADHLFSCPAIPASDSPLKSRFFRDTAAHFAFLLIVGNKKPYTDSYNLGAIEIRRLEDMLSISETIIHAAPLSQKMPQSKYSPAEVSFLRDVLRSQLVIREVVATSNLSILAEYLIQFTRSYESLIQGYTTRDKNLSPEELTVKLSYIYLSFSAFISSLLGFNYSR